MSRGLIYIPEDQIGGLATSIATNDTVVGNERTAITNTGALLSGVRVRFAQEFNPAKIVTDAFGTVTVVGGTSAWVYGDAEIEPSQIINHLIGGPAVASTTAVLAAVTDNGSARDIYRLPADTNHATSQLTTPTSAPAVTAVAAATGLLVGDFSVCYTVVDTFGFQTMPSPTTILTIASGDKIVFPAIALPTGAVALNIFMSKAADDAVMRHKGQATGAAVDLTTLPVNFVFADPDFTRGLTATSGGTAGDIKAVQVTAYGGDYNGDYVYEVLPIFTVNSATTVTGNYAFKYVWRVQIPAMDGTGATVAFGTSEKLGLAHKLNRNTVLKSFLALVLEGTAATVAVNAAVLAGNTADLNSTLNGGEVRIDYYIGD